MFAAGGDFTLNISSNVASPDIAALAAAAGWNGTGKLTVNITASLVNTLRFPTPGTFPGGVLLIISAGTTVGGTRNGGTALYTRVPLIVSNLGKIYGGGGAGGAGGLAQFGYRGDSITFVFGGGGGDGQGFVDTSSTIVNPLSSGAAGQYAAYAGAVFGGDTSPSGTGGTGGGGGAWGQSGGVGGWSVFNGTADPAYMELGSAGSPAGYYLDGTSYVSFMALGDVLGRVI